MDVRRVGEVLLRSHPTNLISAVSRPSQQQYSRILSNRRSQAGRHISESSRRMFSTSPSRAQQEPSEKDAPPSQQSAQQEASPRDEHALATLRNVLNANAMQQNVSAADRARRSASSGQPSLFAGDPLKQAVWATNSLEDAATKRAAAEQNNRASTSPKVRDMLVNVTTFANRNINSGQRPGAKWHFLPNGMVQTTTQQQLMAPPDKDSLRRLGPSHGRTVPLFRNDLVGALRKMDTLVNVNGIRKAYFAQKFYERPGLKRKRLASQRWRNRFMQGFKATVQTVQHLKRQGW